jgi:hypothetical protein
MALTGNSSGQQVWWGGSHSADKRLASYAVQLKSTIASSTASVTVAWWAIPVL